MPQDFLNCFENPREAPTMDLIEEGTLKNILPFKLLNNLMVTDENLQFSTLLLKTLT